MQGGASHELLMQILYLVFMLGCRVSDWVSVLSLRYSEVAAALEDLLKGAGAGVSVCDGMEDKVQDIFGLLFESLSRWGSV